MSTPPPTPTIDNTEAPAPETPAGNNTLQGAASDDSGSQPTTPNSERTRITEGETSAPGTSDSPSINAPESPEATREDAVSDDNTQGVPPYENEIYDRAKIDPGERPGKRLDNPLGSLASYTYQLSLYMISPDAYDAFIASGRRNINIFNDQLVGSIAAQGAGDSIKDRGVFLVAQSGGMATGDRASDLKYDYYIDDLSFKHLINAKETAGPVANINFKFKIIEPYGFSLITNLKKAQERIRSTSTVNPAKQFFMLGIRFYGWNKDGTQVNGNEIIDGNPLDFNAPGNGAIFETFYDLVVSSIKFKIDGKASVYDFTAAAVAPSASVNLRRGMINSAMEVYGRTVRDMLSGPKGLITMLNKEQQTLKENGTIDVPVTYKVKWLGDAEQIALAEVVSATREDKSVQSSGQAENTEQVTPAAELNATPNKNQEKLSFNGAPIVQAIDQILARSKYIEDAMIINYKDSKEADPETKRFPIDESPNKKFSWYRITPEISNIEWDKKLNDWSYTITYTIQTYLVPILDNRYVQNNINYYGPHKRYAYWYTGENKEIISYEQVLNNTYFTNVLGGGPKNSTVAEQGNTEGNASSIPGQGATVAANMPVPGDGTGTGQSPNMASINSVRTSLYDPGSFATAKISILGDPDYLMQEVATGSTGINRAYSRFYKDGGFTINPSGGQVFIEIDFKEGVDYNSTELVDLLEDGRGVTGTGGTLAINDSILFWDYAPEVRKRINGISYLLISVTNNFRGGAFTQQLSAVINDFGTKTALSAEGREALEAETNPESENAVGTPPNPETPDPPQEAGNANPAAAANNLDNAG
jgi:hypothetical protein